MIVLEVLPALESGGAQLSVLETVAVVASAGGRALVASAGGRMVPAVASAGGTHFRLPLETKNPVAIWRNAKALGQLMRSERVDIVHAHSRAPAWSALIAAGHAGAAFVTTWHGTYEETLPFKRHYNSVMAKGDRVIAVSRFIAERIATRHGIAAPRLIVVPPGVDPQRFDPASVAPERIRGLAKAWAIPEGHPIVMLAARMVRWKGHAVLLEALARMERDDAFGVFVGPLEGRERYVSELRRLAVARGIAGRVRFAGACADMPAAFMLADVVVNASTAPEAFGRVLIEAEAMARPVIATDHGAATETIVPEETGWRVAPSDPAALAAALERILALDHAVLQAVGRAARAAVIRSYSLAAMQKATLAIYRELLAARGNDPGAAVAAETFTNR